MKGDLTRQAILHIISRIEQSRETQNEIDAIYEQLCQFISREMETSIPKYGITKKTNKRLKNKRPYWNEELQSMWNLVRDKENVFLKFRGNNRSKSCLRAEYTTARDKFDKTLRREERAYRRSKALDIERMSTTNPNDFWREIQKLGPRKNKDIPTEIVDENGMTINEEALVFEH